MTGSVVAVVALLVLVPLVTFTAVWLRARRELTTPTERAVHTTLHTASLAARQLFRGVVAASAALGDGPWATDGDDDDDSQG